MTKKKNKEVTRSHVGRVGSLTKHRCVVFGQETMFCRLCCLQLLFSRFLFCLPCPLPAMPTALIKFLPPFILLAPVHSILLVLCLHPVHVHVRQDRRLVRAGGLFPVRASSLPAARLSRWQLQHGPAVAARAPVRLLTPSFSCRVHLILGHGCSVNFVSKMSVVNTCASPGMSRV